MKIIYENNLWTAKTSVRFTTVKIVVKTNRIFVIFLFVTNARIRHEENENAYTDQRVVSESHRAEQLLNRRRQDTDHGQQTRKNMTIKTMTRKNMTKKYKKTWNTIQRIDSIWFDLSSLTQGQGLSTWQIKIKIKINKKWSTLRQLVRAKR